jgi:hypothetical protein
MGCFKAASVKNVLPTSDYKRVQPGRFHPRADSSQAFFELSRGKSKFTHGKLLVISAVWRSALRNQLQNRIAATKPGDRSRALKTIVEISAAPWPRQRPGYPCHAVESLRQIGRTTMAKHHKLPLLLAVTTFDSGKAPAPFGFRFGRNLRTGPHCLLR